MANKKKNTDKTAKKAVKAAEEAAKKNPKVFIAIVVVLLIIIIVAGLLWYFLVYKKKKDVPTTPLGVGNLAEISSADLSIHFLELGVHNAGDCVLIKVGNTEVLIDAGAKSTSAPTQAMLDYVASYCTDGVLEYVVATHAHEDHIAGLVGQESGDSRTGFLYQYKIGTIIQFAMHNTTSKIYNNYDAAVKYCETKGTKVYTALECVKGENGAKATYYLDEVQSISLNILYQKYYETKDSGGENNYSVCTLLTQKIGTVSNNYLFTGDLEKKGEESLVESNPDLPHCVLFKGGHHGSSTSSNDVLLNKITPENIAICTCAGTYEYADKPDSDHPDRYLNTFPTQEAIDRMSKHTKNIYVTSLGILNEDYSTKNFTSMNGNIVFYYGKSEEEAEKSLKLWCSNNTTILKETAWFKENRTWSGV
ncbi:MAG: MBL fold metallo-hydrolase [Clostridia bacterium]|nr:MBL fold metallo-hydrolase [Clostridia bacterium]